MAEVEPFYTYCHIWLIVFSNDLLDGTLKLSCQQVKDLEHVLVIGLHVSAKLDSH